jgi:capsular polysaccharide biosynthesis protein
MPDTPRPLGQLAPLEQTAPEAHSRSVDDGVVHRDGQGDGATAAPAVPAQRSPAAPADPKVPPPRKRVRRATVAVLAALAVVVGAASGYGYSIAQPTIYGAEAEFLLTPRPELSDAAVDRAMVTQVMLIRSPTVLQPVAAQTGTPLDDLLSTVKAEIVGRSNILRITAGDRNRARALSIVQAVAAGYPRAATQGQPDDQVPIRVALLTPARSTEEPLAPRPLRGLAAGTLVGLLVAAAVVVVLWRPWRLVRPAPYWTT